jgi:hypothetical protein
MRGILISLCLLLIALIHYVLVDFGQLKKDGKFSAVFLLFGIILASLYIYSSSNNLTSSEVILIIFSGLVMTARILMTFYRRNNL